MHFQLESLLSEDLILWYDKKPLRGRNECRCRRDKIDFPHGSGFAKPFPRTWDASDGILRNYACKDAQKGQLPLCSFASFGVSLRALSGASRDASEEVFVFRLFRCLPGRKPEEDEDELSRAAGVVMSR